MWPPPARHTPRHSSLAHQVTQVKQLGRLSTMPPPPRGGSHPTSRPSPWTAGWWWRWLARTDEASCARRLCSLRRRAGEPLCTLADEPPPFAGRSNLPPPSPPARGTLCAHSDSAPDGIITGSWWVRRPPPRFAAWCGPLLRCDLAPPPCWPPYSAPPPPSDASEFSDDSCAACTAVRGVTRARA